LFATIEVFPQPGCRILELQVPQLRQTFRYDLDDLPPRQRSLDQADFALAAIHETIENDWKIPFGAICISTTDIVMQAGCSSSTAFITAWILVLAKLAGKHEALLKDPIQLAKQAHKAEVLHFDAPGGTMDHMSIALGCSCLRIGPGMWQYERLESLSSDKDGVWILADSGNVKDTFGHLRRCKNDRLELLEKLGGSWDVELSNVELSHDEAKLLKATLINRATEDDAAKLWRTVREKQETSIGEQLGHLMLQHHEALRDGLELSTATLEAMRDAAIGVGAWGFKLVGSGGGGYAVAWTPRRLADVVQEALLGAGAKQTWTIDKPGDGARIQL
jgi:galactokinase